MGGFARLVMALIAVLALVGAPARPAEAGIDWCDGDPIVRVDVGGKQYAVHATNGVPREHAELVDQPDIRVLSVDELGTRFASVTVALTPQAKTNGAGLVNRAAGLTIPARFRLSLPGQKLTNEWSYGTVGVPMVQTLRFSLR